MCSGSDPLLQLQPVKVQVKNEYEEVKIFLSQGNVRNVTDKIHQLWDCPLPMLFHTFPTAQN